jgi:hypothetical protein
VAGRAGKELGICRDNPQQECSSVRELKSLTTEKGTATMSATNLVKYTRTSPNIGTVSGETRLIRDKKLTVQGAQRILRSRKVMSGSSDNGWNTVVVNSVEVETK